MDDEDVEFDEEARRAVDVELLSRHAAEQWRAIKRVMTLVDPGWLDEEHEAAFVLVDRAPPFRWRCRRRPAHRH